MTDVGVLPMVDPQRACTVQGRLQVGQEPHAGEALGVSYPGCGAETSATQKYREVQMERNKPQVKADSLRAFLLSQNVLSSNCSTTAKKKNPGATLPWASKGVGSHDHHPLLAGLAPEWGAGLSYPLDSHKPHVAPQGDRGLHLR